MPGNGDDTAVAMSYPPTEEYARWKAHADQLDSSISGYIAMMVQAGRKKFSVADVEPDATNAELREQRDDLRAELAHARSRISDLESRLYHSDSAELERFVSEHVGASFTEVVEHLQATVPQRANAHIDAGDLVKMADGTLHLTDELQELRQEAYDG